MIRKNKIFWLTYIYLIAIILIRFIPIIFPGSRAWGFNHLIFLPDIYTYCFFALSVIALTIPFIRSSEKAGEKLVDWFADKFLDGRQKYLYRFLFIAVMTSLFAIFAAPTHFMGDGYAVIINLASEIGILVKWSEIGIIQLMKLIRDLLGPPNLETSRLAFQIVSIISGAISIYFMFLISQVASKNSLKRFIIFICSFFSGTLLLFFGYAEYYHIVWVFMTGFIYFSLKYLRSGSGIVTVWLFLIIGTVLHIQMIVFFPPALVLTLASGKGLVFYNRFKIFIWSAVGLFSISCLYLLIHKYMTNLYVEDVFLPLFSGKPVYPEYAILSVRHLLDIFNQFVLVSPLLFLLLLINSNNLKNIIRNKAALFLGLSTVGSLLFMFVIDPKLAFPRDWDLFSISCFSLLLLSIILINKNQIEYFKKLLISIMLILSIYSLPFLLTNLNTDRSEKYIESLIMLDASKSMSSMTILTKYYKENGDIEKYDSLIAIYNNEFMQARIIASAIDAVLERDLEAVRKYEQLIKPDKYNSDYHGLMAMINSASGQYEKALNDINKALQLRQYSSANYWTRSRILFSLNKTEMAINDLREAHRLDPLKVIFLDAISYIFDLGNQPDSCVYYAKKTLTLDSTRFPSYRYIIKWMARAGQFEKAEKYRSMYVRFSPVDSVQQNNLLLLDSLIINKGK